MENRKEKAPKRDIKRRKRRVIKWGHGRENERKIDPLSEGKEKQK